MILSFTCLEKLDALRNRTCSHTFRVNAERFVKKDFRILENGFVNPLSDFHDLQLYWNQRGIKKYEVCKNCGESLFKTDFVNKLGNNGYFWSHKEHGQDFICERGNRIPLRLLGTGKIISIRKTTIGAITEEEAVADGFEVWSGFDFPRITAEEAKRTKTFTAKERCIDWLLNAHKGATLDDIVFGITWRWVELGIDIARKKDYSVIK